MAATHTTHLNLNKPDRQDFVSVVHDINDNMDILDQAYGDMSTFRTIPFTIATADWTASGNNWVYELASAYISATSNEFCIPNSDYTNCNAHIIIEKRTGNDGLKFTADKKPSNSIGGTVYVFDKDDHKIPILMEGTVVPIENGGTGQSTLAGAKQALGVTALAEQIGNLKASHSTVQGTTDVSGNLQVDIPSGYIGVGFAPNQYSTDCNYNLFFSKAIQKWYIHASSFSTGAAETSKTVYGEVYYIQHK